MSSQPCKKLPAEFESPLHDGRRQSLDRRVTLVTEGMQD